MPKRTLPDSDSERSDDESNDDESDDADKSNEDNAEESGDDGAEESAPNESAEEEADGGASSDSVPDASSPETNQNLSASVQQLRVQLLEKRARVEELETELKETQKIVKSRDDQLEAMRRSEEALRAKLADTKKDSKTSSNKGSSSKSTALQASSRMSLVRSPGVGARDPDDIALGMILPINRFTVDVPYSYKNTGFHFPHGIKLNKAGVRQYVVESRNQVHLACQLRNVPKRCNATEIDLDTTKPVFFKLEVCFSSGEVISSADLKNCGNHLFHPPETANPVRMTRGTVHWKFLPRFLSRNTKPVANQEFIFRVSCINPELAKYDLQAESESFVVVSRSTKTKSAAPPVAEEE